MEQAAGVEVCVCHPPGSKLCRRASYKGCERATAVVTLAQRAFSTHFLF